MMPTIPISLSIPIDPEFLNRQMQAVSHRIRGELKIPNFRLTFLVPAGGRVDIPFVLPKGFYCTRRSPLRFESDYYSKDITIDVKCDDNKVNPYPMPLDHPFEVDFGTYYVKKDRVDISIVNNSTVDAFVTFQVVPHIISERLYREFYEPLVNLTFDVLQEVIRSIRVTRVRR